MNDLIDGASEYDTHERLVFLRDNNCTHIDIGLVDTIVEHLPERTARDSTSVLGQFFDHLYNTSGLVVSGLRNVTDAGFRRVEFRFEKHDALWLCNVTVTNEKLGVEILSGIAVSRSEALADAITSDKPYLIPGVYA